MDWIDRLVVVICKAISYVSTTLRLGAGETWPGEIALMIRPQITKALATSVSQGSIVIAGTNGKTTTALMIKAILEKNGSRVIHNASGANLLNGIVSSFIKHADWSGEIDADYAVFEVDENSLPILLSYITPKRIVLLNLFRDQLDRYGEVDVIVEKWEKALSQMPQSTEFVINSDDPGVATLGKKVKGKVIFFGVNDKKHFLKSAEHATDSTFCSVCGSRLVYEGIYYSHIGIWHCSKCHNKRPKPDVHTFPNPLSGLYNQYNTLAAVALSRSLDISESNITHAFTNFSPAFGRQEQIVVGDKTIKLFLSKNPAGFNASLRTVLELGAKEMLFVLNDRIPDGRDVSWIWDVDFEMIPESATVMVSGDRVYDMALRIQYTRNKTNPSPRTIISVLPLVHVYESLGDALSFGKQLNTKEPLYVLATYSGMLETRKILKGRKIL